MANEQDQPARVERRLAAIVAADVAGYSRLMGLDEVGTARTLREHRKVTDALVAKHGGRLVKSTGDGVLLEFPSVVDAVECAVAVQAAMAERNEGIPEDRRMLFRIGVNLGDVLIEGEDILGDGVNIAARLETLAEAGGICVSSSAYDHVRSKVAVEFTDLGEQNLKNIERPVRVYATKSPGRVQAAAHGTAAPQREPQKPLPLPDKPSIAVLPFQNMSGDPEQEYFADGMVEDVITALSRFKSLFVIARNSSFTYKGKAVDIKQVGRELGVRYVLEGSVRKAGGRVRITGQLIEAASGGHIWADRIDGPLADVFELQDEVTQRVVGAIEPSITQAEIARAQEKATSNLDAYDLYLRAAAVHYSQTPADIDESLRLLDRAIELDPDYSWAKAFAAYIHAFKVTQGWVRRSEQEDGRRLAREAIVQSRDDPNTLGYAAHALAMLSREYDVPVACMDRSLKLNPNSANVLVRSGHLRTYVSDADLAIAHFTRAIRLTPLDPQLGFHYVGLAVAYLMKGQFEEALDHARRATREMPRWIGAWVCIAVAAVRTGQQQEAEAAVQQVLALSPGYTIAKRHANSFFRDQWVSDIFDEGLRAAGLPEG